MKCRVCDHYLAVYGTVCWVCRDDWLRRIGLDGNRNWPMTMRNGY